MEQTEIRLQSRAKPVIKFGTFFRDIFLNEVQVIEQSNDFSNVFVESKGWLSKKSKLAIIDKEEDWKQLGRMLKYLTAQHKEVSSYFAEVSVLKLRV